MSQNLKKIFHNFKTPYNKFQAFKYAFSKHILSSVVLIIICKKKKLRYENQFLQIT